MTINTNDLRVVGFVGPILAGVFTIVRLFERFRRRQFGVDDAWAVLSLTVLIIFEVALFLHIGNPARLSQMSRVAMYYIMAQGFYAIIWPARMSILYSVVRFTPQASNLKKILYYFAVSFLVLWCILFAQIFWVCEPIHAWKDSLTPQCPLTSDVAIAQLISERIFLIAAPLRLLWHLEVPRAQRNRLIVVFAASICTTAASLVHAIYILRTGGVPVLFAAVIEQCVSLLVCNLAVIAGLMVRLGDSRKRSLGVTGRQSILQGRTRAINVIDGGAGDRDDFKARAADMESGTQLKILRVVEVHTESDSFSHKDDTQVISLSTEPMQ
ncbi:hypothetical protein C0995_010334 [Termitomyces sp. Mi166|nr:hypothetical protein C0995_010334 [Termitomyces sp. Mi166\